MFLRALTCEVISFAMRGAQQKVRMDQADGYAINGQAFRSRDGGRGLSTQKCLVCSVVMGGEKSRSTSDRLGPIATCELLLNQGAPFPRDCVSFVFSV